ncbi:acyl-CoA dehydrogenase family protein [Actinomycetospora flava]|uniref:Acyl-CoA dehydrogenase family protein n=1 Tax=Actinomycetospora flava TaxID=3129232 RepID=A0ABU8M3I1_9PSEU
MTLTQDTPVHSPDAVIAGLADDRARRELEGIRPFAQVEALRDAGVTALRVPREHGGAGITLREFVEKLIEIGRADSDVAQILRAHFAVVETLRLVPGADAWFDVVTRGEIIGNAVTEATGAHAGDFVNLGTRFVPDGDGYRITGEKAYSTGTLYASRVWVWGVTPDGVPINAIVPTDRAGVTVSDDWDGFGQRATGTGTTRFDDVRAEPDEVFAAPEGDEPPPRSPVGAFLQLYLTAIVAGIALDARDDAITLIRSRSRSFTHAGTDLPREDPVLLAVVGEIAAKAEAAKNVVLAAADTLGRALDEGGSAEAAALDAAQAKLVVDALALEATTQLFDVGGASATRRGANLDRHWRNVRTLASHNPDPLKSRVIGEHLVLGTDLPDNTYF